MSLAEAELFRVRWSAEILMETERALTKIFAAHEHDAPAVLAARQVSVIRRAFPEALVDEYSGLEPEAGTLPDAGDAHVIAAALQCRASVLVTENIRHFPTSVLGPMAIEVKTSDDFIADAIDLDPLRAVNAIAEMRARFNNPQLSSAALILRYESQGFIQIADLLRPYATRF